MALLTPTLEQPPAAFDAWAGAYDDVFTESCIGRAQRTSVWGEIDRLFNPGQHILEINCGTGVDALHLARRGVHVVACDASGKMIAAATDRLLSVGYEASVDWRVLPTERIWQIESPPLFDGALSNFAGLNCVEDLSGVGRELARLLKPGAKLVVCVFGRWCAWEIFWFIARENRRKAFRRLDRQGTRVRVGSTDLLVYYPSVRDLRRAFTPFFRLKARMGVGVLVPPSYLEPLAIQYPDAFRAASYLDQGVGRIPFLRCLADHLLLTFERVGD